MKRSNSEASFEVIMNCVSSNEDQSSGLFTDYFDFQPINKPKEERSNSAKKNCSRISFNSSSVINNNTSQADKAAKCELIIEKCGYPCKAKLRPYQLLLILEKNVEQYSAYESDYYKISFNAIAEINKTQSSQTQLSITILTKDYRKFTLKLSSADHLFVNTLIESAYHNEDSDYYQYAQWFFKQLSQSSQLKKIQSQINGWNQYNIEAEFIRQRIDFNNKDSRYRLLNNANYKYCNTYPKQILIPSTMTDKDIDGCLKFRTKDRFPALTYQYKNNRCIWRSSQSKGGLCSQKNIKDVLLLTTITDSSKKLIIYDARPYLSAFANQLQGNGFENTYHYPKIKIEIIFCYINNIHAIRASLNKLFYALQGESKYLTYIDSSFWYEYITLIIKTSFEISKSIKNDCTVLIHCSDGWDRTTQLCSISQLILDPYYRTLAGFIVLIEKDWLSFGHQFALRNGNCIKGEDQCSPIFLQWLDAIYQLLIQNYSKFEFNADLLTFLGIELYNGKYGTFLFNSELEREAFRAKETTDSIWTYVLSNRNLFINPFFNSEENDFTEELVFQPRKVRLWDEFMFKYEGKSITRRIIEKTSEKDKEIEGYKKALAELSRFTKGKKEIQKDLSDETIDVLGKCGKCMENNGLSSYVVIDNKEALSNKARDKEAKDITASVKEKEEKGVDKVITVVNAIKKSNALEIFDLYL